MDLQTILHLLLCQGCLSHRILLGKGKTTEINVKICLDSHFCYEWEHLPHGALLQNMKFGPHVDCGKARQVSGLEMLKTQGPIHKAKHK